MTRITRIERLDETIQPPSGLGDCFQLTWASNGNQYTSVCDGFGWDELPEFDDKFFNSRAFAIRGEAPHHTFQYVHGYPELLNDFSTRHTFSRYYGFGIVAVGDSIYQFLSTLREPSGAGNNAFIGAKLIYSDDNGKTWRNQDGSTPVHWETWDERTKENMVFFNEPDTSFAILAVLQMGQNYRSNRDGFVYLYAPNGIVDGKMNQLVMSRVKKERILDRGAYEFFVSRDSGGGATWSHDINQRGVVCSFPEGWVYEPGESGGGHAYGWQPSLIYNEPLDTYIMANWSLGVGDEGASWFAKPSYLGFWTAPKPWGPWTQVHEETAWLPGGRPDARPYQPQISPKWISDDGKSFWFVWTDFRDVGGAVPFHKVTSTNLREHLPEYAFNCQQVRIHTE